MRVSPLALAAMLLLGGLSFGIYSMPAKAQQPQWRLVWSDEFNGQPGSLPDSSKWSIMTGARGWGNHELESYTDRPENVQQRDGNLVITARKESFTGRDKLQRDYTSARLQTKDHFAQTYGRFEARMRLPSGKGMWPAFWLLGNDVDTSQWPASGEIDVMENIGDPHLIYSTIHGPGYSGKDGLSTKFSLPAGETANDGFHVYALEWSPGRLRFFFDDHLIVERTPKDLPSGARWVYDHPFFMLLNLAVGGDWPGSPNQQTPFPQRLLVDYVRVYEAANPQASAQQNYPYRNADLPVEQRIDNILSLLTLDEKIDCLGTHPNVPRLGIQASGQVEGLHGLAEGGPANWGGKNTVIPTTQFPQSVGLGETWDPELLQKAAAVEADEARYAFQSPKFKNTSLPYDRTGIVVRAPNSDLARDPRWGRTEESFGEDPFLTGTMAVAFVRGLQGSNPKYWETASLLKHFMANSNEYGRDGSSSDFDQRLLREYYSAPFRMGIESGGARAFMTAYNAVNGIPMAASPLLKDMVMKQWDFDGIICTDAGALTNMVTAHRYYRDMDHAAAGAIHAGINQFLDRYKEAVRGALQKHLIAEKDIDENLRGVWRVIIHLGLLDPPSEVPYSSIMAKEGQPDPWNTMEHRAIARQITEKSIVLLKNSNNLLPLDKSALHSIAVVGPRADEVDLDWYSGTPPSPVTPLRGIKTLAGTGLTVNYAASNDAEAAVKAARASDVAVVFIGNHPTCNAGWNHCPDPGEGKEAMDRKSLSIDPAQQSLVEQVYSANPRTIVVLVSSFPYAINWIKQNVPAILHMAHNSEEEGTAIAEVLFGKVNPAGRLVATWPSSMDQLPQMMDYNIRDGRTYMYFKGEPLFPFGFGLSYSTFKYSNLRLAPDAVSVDVRNTSNRAGDEVVQLYVKHLNSHVARPNEELKGFRRVTLGPGEMKTVELTLKPEALAYWDVAENRWVVEHDKVKVMVGTSSADLKLEKTLQVH